MYLQHFGFEDFPFKLSPDTDYLFMSPSHSKAIAYMEYATFNREGFVVITGEVGSGKTTLVEKFMMGFDENIIFAKIFQTQLSDVELLQAILVEFGLNPFKAEKIELLNMLNQFLIEKYLEGKQILLIIDNAQNLSKRALTEITMLSGVETQKEKILHVVLVGESELNTIIASPEMEQLFQRVSLRYNLRHLSKDETKQYIFHRLSIAGTVDDELFNDEIFGLIFEYTSGVPRLINILCDTILTCCFADDKYSISKKEFSDAIEELQWQSYAESHKVQPVLDLDLGEESNFSRTNDSGLYRVLSEVTNQLTRVADSLAIKYGIDKNRRKAK